MPNFLKTLFKPSPSRHSRPGPLPPGVDFDAPRQATISTQGEDVTSMLQLLRATLEGEGKPEDTKALLEAIQHHPAGGQEIMQQLVGLLQGSSVEGQRAAESSPSDNAAGEAEQVQRAARAMRRRKGKAVARNGDEWSGSFEACTGALALATKMVKSSKTKSRTAQSALDRICSLLGAQHEELLDLRAYAEDHPVPTLDTLRDIYLKIESGLQDVKGNQTTDASETLTTLMQVLLEGPDYLIDVWILEAVIWQAEIIDPNFGGDVRSILDRTVARPNDPATFRTAAENVIAISSALPRDTLDDQEGIDAYKAIGLLAKQLQVRLGPSTEPTVASTETSRPTRTRQSSDRSVAPVNTSVQVSAAPSPAGTPLMSPIATPSVSRSTSRTSTPDPDFQSINKASDLEALYGTGPISAPSKTVFLAPTPAVPGTPREPPSPADTDTESEPEIWEYKGNLLTRSALSLVMRQEALAKADSSGQYAGEVSWDDLRNAWVPKWAEKFKEEDMAEGEIPPTNPAEFKVKRKDAWGNAIGWRDGTMFYADEPKFDSAPDES